MYILGYPLLAVVEILNALLFFYTLVIIASALVSWLRPNPHHPVVQILNRLTFPVYIKISRYVPRAGAIDLTPLAALLVIMFIQKGILPIFARIAHSLIGG